MSLEGVLKIGVEERCGRLLEPIRKPLEPLELLLRELLRGVLDLDGLDPPPPDLPPLLGISRSFLYIVPHDYLNSDFKFQPTKSFEKFS